MGSETEGRLDNLEITVEGIKEETAAIRRDLQQMMRLMSGGQNNQGGGSEGSSSSVNENREKGDTGGISHNWRKRVELPPFEGVDPHSWINRVERFFDIQKMAEEDKVELAYISMKGSASYWFKYWREKTKNRTWLGLKAGLINRFGGGFKGTLYEQMATLRQDGTMEEFMRSFEILLGQTQGLSEELILGFFLAGLREEIKGQVRIQDPQDLMVAIRVARDVEDAINRACRGVWNGVKVKHVGTRVSSSIVRGDGDRSFATRTGGTEGVVLTRREGLTTANNTNARGNNPAGGENRGRMVRNLPYPEFLKKREKGRCFRCGGPFAPSHRCSKRSLRVLLVAEDEEEEAEENSNLEAKPLELSACSAEGLTPLKTMKLTGLIREKRVVVLIDSGASHNFISRSVVEELELRVADTPTYAVSLADVAVVEDMYVFELGGFDIILGISWLAKLGEIVINWREMSMQYGVKGKKVTIKVDPALFRQLEEPKTLLKLVDVESWRGDLIAEQKVELWSVLQTHYLGFQERENLSPLCEKVELWSVLQTHYLGFRERENLPPLCDIKHHYRKKFETWKLGLIERKIIKVRRDLETGGGRTKNNKTEENYIVHESFNLSEADTHWTSWLVPMFGVANIVVSVICMYINNCLKNNFGPHGGCVAKFLGRFSFEPMQENSLQENSLLGLSSSTLTEMGALWWDNAGNEHQGWRLDTCIWLYAGIIRLLAIMLSLVFIGIRLEQQFGLGGLELYTGDYLLGSTLRKRLLKERGVMLGNYLYIGEGETFHSLTVKAVRKNIISCTGTLWVLWGEVNLSETFLILLAIKFLIKRTYHSRFSVFLLRVAIFICWLTMGSTSFPTSIAEKLDDFNYLHWPQYVELMIKSQTALCCQICRST
ncbi:hypothetical protein V8G54_033884 [Vigna mungo]|uniref:RHOMBOID-like protein n=1 Tax=Vigna mungo TaxID=3915 RepID=A0AAQ3RI06_VIGMU